MSFTNLSITGSKANPDFVYYNATIVNNTVVTNQTQDDPAVKFLDQRLKPIIADASQYNVAVENFSINGGTKSLPVFIPTIAGTNASDVTTTCYNLTFSCFTGSSFLSATQAIIWVPENVTPFTIVPTTATPIQLESDYYYCYTYTHWVDLMNRALLTAWTSAGGTEAFGTQCPFFEYDETTGLFSLNQDANTSMVPYGSALQQPYDVTSSATSPCGSYAAGEYSFVGMNANLEGLIANFDSIYYSYEGAIWAASGTVYLPEVVFNFGITNLNNTSTNTPYNSGVSLKTKPAVSSFQLTNPFTGTGITNAFMVRMTQDFISTGSLWSPMASFVFYTALIPVRVEECANPVTIGTGNVLASGGGAGTSQKVLLEVPINAVTADLWRGWVLYEPLKPTFSNLADSREGVTQLDISVYWRNRLTNSLTPLKLYNGGTTSIRLKFQRRDIEI